MTPLYAELHRWSALPFQWGATDCATSVADWLIRLGWPDAMADVRGLYDDVMSCERATGFIRDPLTAVSVRLDAIGMQRGNDLCAGDVGLIRVPGATRPAAAVWTGHSWAAKGEAGTTTINPALVEIVAFWSAGYRP